MTALCSEDLLKYTFGNKVIEKYLTKRLFKPETKFEHEQLEKILIHEMPSLKERWIMPKDQHNTWKLERLSTLSKLAYETSDFYQNSYSGTGYDGKPFAKYSDFSKLPILTRDNINQNFYSRKIFSNKIDPEFCRYIYTSGSSGKPIKIAFQQERIEIDTILRMRMFEFMAGQELPRDRWIYSINHAYWWYTSINGHLPIFTVSQNCPLDAVVSHIKKLKPAFVTGITSYIRLLAERGIDLAKFGVLGVSTNSESSTASERKWFSERLGVKVCDEYSSEEGGLLAHECSFGKYHLVSDDSHLEIVNPNKHGVGDVIVTDLWNIAVPTIRYSQGDLAKISEGGKCKCGSSFSILEELHGRADESFINNDGDLIPSGKMLEYSDRFLCTCIIHEFQVHQHHPSKIEVLYSEIPGVQPDLTNTRGFEKGLVELFGHDLNFEYICLPSEDEFPKGNKRRVFKCHLERNEY